MKKLIRQFLVKNTNSKTINIKDKLPKSNIANQELYYKILSFGKKNPNKIFYVIQRAGGGGMFSNLNYVLHHLYISDKLGFIPVIDMENYKTYYNESLSVNGTKNSWNYYFEPVSKYSLKEVYSSQRVIITDGKTRGNFLFDGYDKLSFDHKKIFYKFVKIKKSLINEKNNFIKKNFKNKKILGIHFRGTDQKTAQRHPLPATKKQIINLIDSLDKKHNYDKIFLATEEKDYYDLLKKRYPNLIHYSKHYTKKRNIFFEDRKGIRFQLGKEVIIDMMLLSNVDHLIGVRSNVVLAAKYFSKKKIKYFEIKNGFNSNNLFIANIKWYLKSVLPHFLGGFKIKF